MNDNIGWKGFISDSIEEFHDIPHTWEEGSKVSFSKLSISRKSIDCLKSVGSLTDEEVIFSEGLHQQYRPLSQ